MMDSVIVTVSDNSLNFIKKRNTYFYPKNRKFREDIKYIYFYTSRPTQAITCYAEIDSRIDDANSEISIIEKIQYFSDPSKAASAMKLKSIRKLNSPIKLDSESHAIQGRRYINSESVSDAKFLKDLY